VWVKKKILCAGQGVLLFSLQKVPACPCKENENNVIGRATQAAVCLKEAACGRVFEKHGGGQGIRERHGLPVANGPIRSGAIESRTSPRTLVGVSGQLSQGGRLVGTPHMSSPDLCLLAATVCEIGISGWPPSVSSPATLNAVLQNCRKLAQEPWAYSCVGDCARLAQGVRGGLT